MLSVLGPVRRIAICQRVAPAGVVSLWAWEHPSAAPLLGLNRQKDALMFESLSERLGSVFDKLTKAGALSEADVDAALREVRTALLEADVSLPVARDFIKAVKVKATGQAVTKSITPGQQVVKIVHDELVHVLAGDGAPDALKIDNPPSAILMVGLQG